MKALICNYLDITGHCEIPEATVGTLDCAPKDETLQNVTDSLHSRIKKDYSGHCVQWQYLHAPSNNTGIKGVMQNNGCCISNRSVAKTSR